MRDDCGPFSCTEGHFTLITTVGMVVVLASFLTIFAPPAEALPSFARQTGQPCGTCHTDFPALTPYGRRFKLLGYTIGGGKFRTTPFPSGDDARAAADAGGGLVMDASAAAGRVGEQGWLVGSPFTCNVDRGKLLAC
jgi:hypothetical protein